MKYFLFIFIVNVSLFGDDPTVLRGALKKVFMVTEEKKPEVIKDTPKETVEVVENISGRLQEDVNKIVYKAFYTKDSIKRLLIEYDKQRFQLETDATVILNGEEYLITAMTAKQLHLEHVNSKHKIVFTYRP